MPKGGIVDAQPPQIRVIDEWRFPEPGFPAGCYNMFFDAANPDERHAAVYWDGSQVTAVHDCDVVASPERRPAGRRYRYCR
jgi:hypothetical protein